MGELTIKPQPCNWLKLAYKDKRKGYSWRCRTCSHRGGGKLAPKCPCKEIEIPRP